MRIKFRPIKEVSTQDIQSSLNHFQVVKKLLPSQNISFDNFTFHNVQSYSDDARYILDLYQVKIDRLSAYGQIEPLDNTNNLIQVFELTLNFTLDLNFKLFSPYYVDYWRNDHNIKYVAPSITYNVNPEISYLAFRSLATSFFMKMMSCSQTNKMLCEKNNERIIFAYQINQDNVDCCDEMLDHFINAIYEMVKVTSSRFDYLLPDNVYTTDISLKDWYDRRSR